jgi:hypothetical protein
MGLCARVKTETVNRIAGVALEPGEPSPELRDPELSCQFRGVGQGVLVVLKLLEPGSLSLDNWPDDEDIEVLGVPAEISADGLTLCLDSDEGLLMIRIPNYDLTAEEFRAGAVQLAEEFIRSG